MIELKQDSQKNTPEVKDIKCPLWFKLIVIATILFNILEIIDFYIIVTVTPEQIERIPLEHQELFNSIPIWIISVFALGVFGRTIGSIGLLFQKTWARVPLLISLAAFFIGSGYWLFFTTAIEVHGVLTYVRPIIVFVVACLLLGLYHKGIKKGYVR